MADELKTELLEIFKILSLNPKLGFFDKEKVNLNLKSGDSIFKLTNSEIKTPLGDYSFDYLSSLQDSRFEHTHLQSFIGDLTQRNSIIRLNHIGICYKVSSQSEERSRLVNEVTKTPFNIYEEKSNDKGLWLFIGNTSIWNDPLLEMLPVEDVGDKWVDYWLPHFQIDIDTNLTCEEIENIAFKAIGNTIKPIRVTIINNIVYTVRIRLGVVSGVNINLDIATKNRNVEYARNNLLHKLN